MTKAEKYLAQLEHEMNVWRDKVDAKPGNAIDSLDMDYRRSCTASAKYAAAAYMMKLMKEENKNDK